MDPLKTNLTVALGNICICTYIPGGTIRKMKTVSEENKIGFSTKKFF